MKIGQTNPRGGGEDDHDGGGNLSFLTVIHEPKFRFRPTLTRNFARLPPISRLKAFLVSLENVPDKNVIFIFFVKFFFKAGKLKMDWGKMFGWLLLIELKH